ncbi:hypothetical protein [Vreelandella aquamarina]|uniref:hypothetical protein n=1 Tax=Vreelandella aquamarina TaxID=77097 RepID=UPI0038503EAC
MERSLSNTAKFTQLKGEVVIFFDEYGKSIRTNVCSFVDGVLKPFRLSIVQKILQADVGDRGVKGASLRLCSSKVINGRVGGTIDFTVKVKAARFC